MRAAMEQVGRKPTQGKRWRIAAPKQHFPYPHQIVHHRAVEFCDEVFLQPAAVGRGEPCLVGVDLDSDRYACQWARIVSARQRGVALSTYTLCRFKTLLPARRKSNAVVICSMSV